MEQRLLNHDWPGNIRELRKVLGRADLNARSGVIELRHLPKLDCLAIESGPEVRSGWGAMAAEKHSRYVAPDDPNEEHQRIEAALRLESGSVPRAAQQLGMSRSTLYYKIHQHCLVPKAYRGDHSERP